MRIIGGEARGRKLLSPKGRTTRPTLDALKERIYNVLGPGIEGLSVLDLFAGAGSFGLEALSRRASSCTFVERDRDTFSVLSSNIELLAYGDRAHAVRGDVLARGERLAAETGANLVFVDPPFPLVESRPDKIASLVTSLAGAAADGARIVVRVPVDFAWPEEPLLTRVTGERVHGRNRFEIRVRG